MHFSSASVAYLETSYIPSNDRFAAMQIVMVTEGCSAYVRFTELLVSSFHFQFAGFEIQIFAMMSGIFDLSKEENAKHFLPRWFKDAPT